MALSTGCDYRRVSTAIPYLQTLGEFLVERIGLNPDRPVLIASTVVPGASSLAGWTDLDGFREPLDLGCSASSRRSCRY